MPTFAQQLRRAFSLPLFSLALLAGCVNPHVGPVVDVQLTGHDELGQHSHAHMGAKFIGESRELTVTTGVVFDFGGDFGVFGNRVYGVRIVLEPR